VSAAHPDIERATHTIRRALSYAEQMYRPGFSSLRDAEAATAALKAIDVHSHRSGGLTHAEVELVLECSTWLVNLVRALRTETLPAEERAQAAAEELAEAEADMERARRELARLRAEALNA
jgi:hypothetical protein